MPDPVQSAQVAAVAARKALLNRLPIDGPDEIDKTFDDPEEPLLKKPANPDVVEIGTGVAQPAVVGAGARHVIQRLAPGQDGIWMRPLPGKLTPVPATVPPPKPRAPAGNGLSETRTPLVKSDPVLGPASSQLAGRLSKDPIISILPPGEAEKRRVCLLLPVYKSFQPATVMSLLGNWDRGQMGVFINAGNALIAEARNQLADTFLRSKFEWALWVDDDMVLPVGNAGLFRRHTGWADFPEDMAGQIAVNRLLSHGKSIVGAVCSGRHPWSRITFSNAARDPTTAARVRTIRERGLEATDWVGTGVLLTHRSVFEDIRAHFPHLAPIGSPGKPGCWRFFTPVADGAYRTMELVENAPNIDEVKHLVAQFRASDAASHGNTGEDVIFCHRARISGHQPYVDLGLICGHVGHQVFGPTNTTG